MLVDMRVFLYSLLGIPLLVADGVLLISLAPRLAGRIDSSQGLFLLAGGLGYVAFHLVVRKPERMYLWAHELTHLAVAKLFFREVHGFHITSRSGGKVVISRTNVAIDLAPYAVPLYNVMVFIPAMWLGESYPNAGKAYLGAAGFLFAMHLYFSAEGFIDGQPDVKRSGRLFSASIVLCCWIFLAPLLAAPGTRHPEMPGLSRFYMDWILSAADTAKRLLERGMACL